MALADNDRISSNALNRVIGNLWTKIKDTFLGKNDKAASAVLADTATTADKSGRLSNSVIAKQNTTTTLSYNKCIDSIIFSSSQGHDCRIHVQGIYKKLADSNKGANVPFDVFFGWRNNSASGDPSTGYCYVYSPVDISAFVTFRVIAWRDASTNSSVGRLYVVNKDTRSGVWSVVELSVVHASVPFSLISDVGGSNWESSAPSSTVTVDSTFTKVLVPSDISGKANTDGSYMDMTVGCTAWMRTLRNSRANDGAKLTSADYITDNNNRTMMAEVDGSVVTECPNNTFWFIEHFRGSDANYASQLALNMSSTTGMAIRQKKDGNWTSWKHVALQDGIYSGLTVGIANNAEHMLEHTFVNNGTAVASTKWIRVLNFEMRAFQTDFTVTLNGVFNYLGNNNKYPFQLTFGLRNNNNPTQTPYIRNEVLRFDSAYGNLPNIIGFKLCAYVDASNKKIFGSVWMNNRETSGPTWYRVSLMELNHFNGFASSGDSYFNLSWANESWQTAEPTGGLIYSTFKHIGGCKESYNGQTYTLTLTHNPETTQTPVN